MCYCLGQAPFFIDIGVGFGCLLKLRRKLQLRCTYISIQSQDFGRWDFFLQTENGTQIAIMEIEVKHHQELRISMVDMQVETWINSKCPKCENSIGVMIGTRTARMGDHTVCQQCGEILYLGRNKTLRLLKDKPKGPRFRPGQWEQLKYQSEQIKKQNER